MNEVFYDREMPKNKDASGPGQDACIPGLEKIFRSIADHSHVGIWLLDAKGNIVYANAAAGEIWGEAPLVSPDEYVTYKAWNYHTGEPLRNEDWAAAKTLATGRAYLDEVIRIQRFSGEPGVVLNSAIPIFEDDGTLTAVVVMNHDVTELKASEAKRDELTKIVSHDLKNPLYAIQMALQVLQTKLDGYMATGNKEKIEHYIEVIKNSAGLCLGLIKDILDKEKIGKGPFQINPDDFLVSELFDSFRPIYEPLAEQKALTVTWNIPKDLNVFCDKERMGQVISNLVGNAIKFTPPGGEIRISVAQVMKDIVFEVEDNGDGISSEHLKKIFKKNYQVQDSPTGTGLGLYIAQTIIDAHRGKIWADSVPGKGTTFYFSVPLR